MKYVLFLMMVLFSNQAVALDCSKQPTCAELNYSKEDNPKCDKNGYILCPYDQSYKKCVQYNCEALGFTESDKTSWCADLIKCKGNEKMTLCQKPCFATNYEELSNLAKSGKCKVVTVRHDITVPQNQSITLAANTTIDGGGHTLFTSANKAGQLFYIKENCTFKNLTIEHHQTETQSYRIIYSENIYFLHDVTCHVKSDYTENHYTYLWGAPNVISGLFKIDLDAHWHWILFANGMVQFKNAELDVDLKGVSSDAIYHANFENSHGRLSQEGALTLSGATLEFTNSQIVFENSSFYADLPENTPKITLNEGSEITFKKPVAQRAHPHSPQIILNGTDKNPAKLILEGDDTIFQNQIQIITKNLTDVLVINGVTYKPTQIGTTLLPEIENSQNWTRVQ